MATAKKQISFKQVGKNVILMVNDEKFSKKIEDAAIRTTIKEKVGQYNTKNTVKLQKEILAFMQVEKDENEGVLSKDNVTKKTIAKKVNVAKDKKVKEKVEKVEQQELSLDEQIKAAKALLEANNYNVATKVAPTPRRGEY